MKLIRTDSGYAILENQMEYPLEWLSKKDMDKFYKENAESFGMPMYYSSDGRLYPNPYKELDNSDIFNGKPKIFKAKS